MSLCWHGPMDFIGLETMVFGSETVVFWSETVVFWSLADELNIFRF